MEAAVNGCAEAFWKRRLCSQTSCVLQCYLQNRKLCPIFATHILRLRVGGGAGQPGRVTSQAQAGSCSDSDARKAVLPATHKNKQTDGFAKIIHVGWTRQECLSQFLWPGGTEDRGPSLGTANGEAPPCWVTSGDFCSSNLSFLFCEGERLG